MLSNQQVTDEDAAFYKELRSVLADCSGFLADINLTLADRCEAMLSQVVADKPERASKLAEVERERNELRTEVDGCALCTAALEERRKEQQP